MENLSGGFPNAVRAALLAAAAWMMAVSMAWRAALRWAEDVVVVRARK
jgi:hypothetical protein